MKAIRSTDSDGAVYVEIIARRLDGRHEIVQDGAPIRTGVEPYRIYVYPPGKGYLYVCQIDANGRVDWLFPRNESKYSYGANPVKGGERLMIPDTANGLTLDEVTGKESVIAVFSREEWPALNEELRAAISDRSSATRPERPVLVRIGVRDDPPRGIGGTSPFASSSSLAELEELMQREAKTAIMETSNGRLIESRWFEHVE